MSIIGLTAIGAYAPEEILTNADLERMVETSDEWITTRTGIRERRLSGKITVAELATQAARNCLALRPHLRPELLVASTGTSERKFPNQASIIANQLNLTGLAGFDLNAACSGLVYSLAVARSMMLTYGYKNTLVTAGEKMTAFVDYTDRASCILFGDGASALLLSSEEPEHEILTTELGMDPTGYDYVTMGGPEKEYYFWQDGKQVFKFAVNKMGELIDLMMERTKTGRDDSFYIIPHQANMRIFEAVARNKGLPMERFITNIDRYGNTSSASIGLALKEAEDSGVFHKGDLLFLIGFGAGLSWAAAAIRW